MQSGRHSDREHGPHRISILFGDIKQGYKLGQTGQSILYPARDARPTSNETSINEDTAMESRF